MAKGFGDKSQSLQMPSRAHDSMQDMRRLMIWEVTAMIVASPDGFASDLRRNLDNWETPRIVYLRMASGEVGRIGRA
jgi:hypothetical protein